MAPRILERWITDAFHKLWYHSRETWKKNTFLGHGVQQLPFDLWLYQELVYRLKPRYIVQTGVYDGGSLLYFAHLLDIVGCPPEVPVIGIDIQLRDAAKELRHPRITLLEGSSVAPEIVAEVKKRIHVGEPCLISLDSDHSQAHVFAEMEAYGPLVAKDSYMVVEDTNINGRPVFSDFGPGPHEAVDQYLAKHDDFVRDDAFWKRNMFSFHQYGWLKKVK